MQEINWKKDQKVKRTGEIKSVAKGGYAINSKMTKANWIAVNTRATNDYAHCSHIFYLYNRWMNSFIKRWLNASDTDERNYAISELIQLIWRSRIRDGKPIVVFFSSDHTIELFNEWLYGEESCQGIHHETRRCKNSINYS